tara:strand:+ start:1171 stop:1341 length:171 start_codon:yes stop_codon:yes gene_type:complete
MDCHAASRLAMTGCGEAGKNIQRCGKRLCEWVPAFAGMTLLFSADAGMTSVFLAKL